jgi:stage II sporulation protein E
MSICDGMGSGREANKVSRLTLGLIENFYRAGFNNDIILSSVNKLLSLNEQENFSTIDLCAIDCRKGFYDFVKLGASSGFILRDTGEIETISSSGLPIGVLENIKPHITKLCVSAMDIVVLVSDGVSDVLQDKIPAIIRNSQIVNPQSLSEHILSLAIEKSDGVPLDDMTVVCVRVFENV